jgi:tetratricopeptide (TPR) repeat protein
VWPRGHRRRIFAVLCGVSILGGIALWVKPWLTGIYHWRQARSELAHGDFLPAKVHLQECVNSWPNHAETRFLLAQACRRGGDLDGCQLNLQAAERLGWSSDAILLEQELSRAQCGDLRQVERKLLACLDGGRPDEALIFESLARGYLENYRLADVVRLATRWKQKDPRSWEAAFYCGQAFERHQVIEKAVEQYREALSLKPGEARVYVALAPLLAARGEFREALDLFQARLAQQHGNTAALLGVAYCQHGLNDNEAALATLDELFARDNRQGGAAFLRGQIELDLDRPEDALIWLRRAEDLKVQDREIAFVLSRCLRRLGREAEALRYQRQWTRLKAESERLTIVRIELAAKPDSVPLRLEAGDILKGHGRYLEAVRWYQTILQIDPGNRPAHKALATCFGHLGDPGRVAYHRKAAAGDDGPEGNLP